MDESSGDKKCPQALHVGLGFFVKNQSKLIALKKVSLTPF